MIGDNNADDLHVVVHPYFPKSVSLEDRFVPRSKDRPEM